MKYIAFFDLEEYLNEHRTVAPAASSVVGYMAEVFSQEHDVEIISPSRTLNTRGFYPGRRTIVNKRVTVIHPPSFGVKTRIGGLLSILFSRVWLLWYLLVNLRSGEELVVYHSLAYMEIVSFLKLIKKLRIILEIREVYADVKISDSRSGWINRFKRNREYRYFSIGDKYIFPTELLNRAINTDNKPYVIACGRYSSVENLAEKIDNGSIHIVYAGTLDPNKGGAIAAVTSTKYLSENYHIHILGYGSEEMIKEIIDSIEYTQRVSEATVTYDGVLYGKDFNRFLQSCHIGLATQNPSGLYNDSSFPSKILTYLSNGLQVLSCRIRAVEESPVGNFVYYYDEQSPESIADAIQKIRIDQTVNGRIVLYQLDSTLKKKICNLFHSDGGKNE